MPRVYLDDKPLVVIQSYPEITVDLDRPDLKRTWNVGLVLDGDRRSDFKTYIVEREVHKLAFLLRGAWRTGMVGFVEVYITDQNKTIVKCRGTGKLVRGKR